MIQGFQFLPGQARCMNRQFCDKFVTEVSRSKENSFVQIAQLLGKCFGIYVFGVVQIAHGPRCLSIGAEMPAGFIFLGRSKLDIARVRADLAVGVTERLVLEDEDASGARHVIGKQILQSVGAESHRDASLLVPNLHLLEACKCDLASRSGIGCEGHRRTNRQCKRIDGN